MTADIYRKIHKFPHGRLPYNFGRRIISVGEIVNFRFDFEIIMN